MKLLRSLCIALPLLFIAATSSLPRHQAIGPVRFGMSSNEAAAALKRLTTRSQDHHNMTAAEARAIFVTNGTGTRLARDGNFDRACPVFINYTAKPMVTRASIASNSKGAQSYETELKQIWENFQDIGDCKFRRVGPKGEYPKMEAFADGKEEVSTDTWEIEGIRVELTLHFFDPSKHPGAPVSDPYYYAVLIATEIAPPAQ